jgi:NAD dependent epimerase/dehydratase
MILVTGADGFIGSHLVEALVAQDYQVKAFVMYNSFGSRGWLDTVPEATKQAINVVAGDIRDGTAVRAAMQGCSGVLHLAALIGIPYSYVAPQSYVDTNVTGTLNVVQAARDLGLGKVVHTSTSEVYGTAQFVPITEEHPVIGQSPYSASKIGADHIALSYHRSFEVPVTVARPFNTYGPRQSARAVIPAIISQIAAGKRTLSLGSMHPTRDFNFVGDTVGGMIAALEAEAAVGEVLNIGSGFEVSIGDTVKMICEVMGAEVEIETDDKRVRPQASEVERLWADNEKLKGLTGWSPKYGGLAGLREGLEITAAWFSDPANLARYEASRYEI